MSPGSSTSASRSWSPGTPAGFGVADSSVSPQASDIWRRQVGACQCRGASNREPRYPRAPSASPTATARSIRAGHRAGGSSSAPPMNRCGTSTVRGLHCFHPAPWSGSWRWDADGHGGLADRGAWAATPRFRISGGPAGSPPVSASPGPPTPIRCGWRIVWSATMTTRRGSSVSSAGCTCWRWRR